MKKLFYLFILLGFALIACNETPTVDEDGFEIFTISAGQHNSISRQEPFTGRGINVTAVFDESAAYTLEQTSDQADINKLIGFSDCGQHHQSESARLGWRWLNDELQILAYSYLEGDLSFELMGSIPLNTEIDMMIIANSGNYVFSGTGLETVTLTRTNNCSTEENYWLWPYFGGNQVAPQQIKIRLKREQID